ncbi:MAG: SMP-30/gluconolactonase/LRE family protein [Acidobacteria bacterium]|nr:SMP-30/gluconolactonase/LRE family protein [Acidobacteriota bacterium]
MHINNRLKQVLVIILALQLLFPSLTTAQSTQNILSKSNYLRTYSKSSTKNLAVRTLKPLQQSSSLQLVGPNNDTNPVVNETNQIQLTAMDNSGNTVTDVTFESGSPDIASIDEKGMVVGKAQGYATVTARKGSDSVSIFVTVAKVNGNKGKQVTGDTKVDSSGAIYISDPTSHVIFKQESSSADAQTFAGQSGSRGKTDGDALKSLFAGPTAVAVDNRAQGGIYVADTLNHSVRKVDFNNSVTTILGSGSPGVNTQDTTSFSQAVFRSPQGIAVNSAGNVFVADTENHAIYIVDFTKQEVRLLAGEPGTSGKVDATGRSARFFRPSSISVQSASTSFFGSSTSEILMVADTGNNKIRSISMDGKVTTVGKINSSTAAQPDSLMANVSPLAESDEFTFNEPRSVSVDELGNIYVVDKSGAKVITQTSQQTRIMSSLGQPNVSFSQAMSVVVKGTQAFVLDNKASSDAEALKVVTVGEPAISNLSQNMDRIDGGSEIVVKGKNFGPESIVILGDSLVRDAIVESATSIRLIVPPQNAPGKRTLSIQTRGGVSQQEFSIFSPPFQVLNDGEITTIAGGIPFLGDGGQALKANLKFPRRIASDGEGNIYIVDTAHNRIRKIDKSNTITSVAGTGASGSGSDGGPAIATPLDLIPAGSVSVDEAGNLLITETTNQRIRRVDAQTGIITTLAGNGQIGFSGDNNLATQSSLSFPEHAVADQSGNIFISDSRNNRIRRVDAKTGRITTVIGNGMAGFSGDNGPALQASLNSPSKIIFDPMGNLLIADTANNRIRLFDTKTGVIRTIAGNGRADFSGDGASATQASLNSPRAIAIGADGKIFIADTGNRRIRAFDVKEGRIITVAGNPTGSFGEGGPAINANIGRPEDVGLDGAGNVLIADSENSLIRSFGRNNIIKTIAGNGRQNFSGDGSISPLASIDLPIDGGLTIDRFSNIFFIDQSNQRIRRIDAKTGVITTVAGNGQEGFSGDGGAATQAALRNPKGLVLDSTGSLLIADTGNNRIRRVDQAGNIRTIAGTGQMGSNGDGGIATSASLVPIALAINLTGDILVADGDRVRVIDNRTGVITAVAGNGMRGFSGDGGIATNASFNTISSIAVDKLGNLVIADLGNQRIRRVDLRSRIVTTIAGNGMRGFMSDNVPATMTSLFNPTGVNVDVDNNLIFADSLSHRIRRINVRTGMIQTIVGTKRGFDGDGEPAVAARLNKPTAVAVNLEGDLAISDTDNNSIRLVKRFDRFNIAPDFSISVTPEIQSVVAGNSTSFNISVDALNNFNGSTDLVAMVSPPNRGIVLSFSPPNISPGRSSTLTVAVSSDVQPTSLSIRITGGMGPLRRSRTVSLSVTRASSNPTSTADFSLSVSPGSQIVKAGSTTSFNISATTRGTLSQGIDLSAALSGTSSGIQTSFSPNSLSVTGGSSTLTVTTSSNASVGDLTIAITGVSGAITRGQTVNLSITPPPVATPSITSAMFSKPTLTINGTALGTSGAVINLNQQNVSSFITKQTDTQILLTGNKKKLGIKKGVNQVTVTVNGVVSNSFTFNF